MYKPSTQQIPANSKRRCQRNVFLVIIGLALFTLFITFLFNQTMPEFWIKSVYDAGSESALHSSEMMGRDGVFNVTSKCDDLLRREYTYRRLKAINAELKQHLPTDNDFVSLAHNCTVFREHRGYNDKPATEMELNFPLAFSISAFKSTFQLEQLLRTIYRPWNLYCIHTDRRSTAEFRQSVQQIARCFDNVFVSAESTAVVWASIYVLEAERLCQRELLKRSRKWKYYINLTGQEFPLKTNREMVEILREFRLTNDIMAYRSDDGTQPNKHRQKWRYRVSAKEGISISNQKKTDVIPGNIKIYKGELHAALTRDFVKFLHGDPTAVAYYRWLNDTFSPDEHYYQSLGLLPYAPGSSNKLAGSKYTMSRAKIWESGNLNRECRSRNFVHTICIFGSFDLPWLLAQPHLFANKFYGDDDPLVLGCLQKEIDRRTFQPIKLNGKFYRRFADTRTWDETGGVKWIL